MLGGRIERKKDRKKQGEGFNTHKNGSQKVATLLIKFQTSSSSTFAVAPAFSQSLFFGWARQPKHGYLHIITMVTGLFLQDKLITLMGTCAVQRIPLNTPCPCDQKTHQLLLTEFTLCTEVTSGYPARARKDLLGYILPCWFNARSGSMYSLEQNPHIVAFHMSQHLDVFTSCECYVSFQLYVFMCVIPVVCVTNREGGVVKQHN